jgi:intein/homing endonuclease
VKTLLRSCFVADKSDRKEVLLRNYLLLQQVGLGFEDIEDTAIWNFIVDFVRTHNHVPEVSTMQAAFAHRQEREVLDRLDVVRRESAREEGDFKSYLEMKVDDRKKRRVTEILKDAAAIITTGLDVQEGPSKGEITRLLGPQAAIKYVLDRGHEIVAPNLGTKLSGEITHDDKDFVSEYERVEADPTAGVGQHTGLAQIDNVTNGAKRSELWLHTAFTGGLKCVTGDTRIWDVSTGRLREVREIAESGDLPEVHGLHEPTWAMTPAKADAVAMNGVRPILRLTTDKGRTIRVSGNHPFFTPDGWKEAGSLQPKDWVGVAESLPNKAPSCFSDEEVMLVGYLLGDGSMRPSGLTFTNGNPAILNHFRDCLDRYGYSKKPEGVPYSTSGTHYTEHLKTDSASVDIHISRSSGDKEHPWQSKLRVLLDRLGLWGVVAKEKTIPGALWAISDHQAWVLLSALWSTDGRVALEDPGQGRAPRAKCWYGSTSRQLCRDIQLLLQRLGVPSTVSEVVGSYEGNPYVSWVVLITTGSGAARFLKNTKIVGKEAEAQAALASTGDHEGDWVPTQFLKSVRADVRARSKKGGWLYARHLSPRRKVQLDTFRRLAEASNDPTALKVAGGQVRWERVASIEPDGEEMTYDLSVPGNRSFVAEGFVTHNSTFALNWAYNQAILLNYDSLIFSLEMPYAQVRRQIVAMHSYHEKFREIRHKLGIQQSPVASVGLPYEKIRDAELDPNARKFLFDHVIPDLKDPSNGYGKIRIEVADPEKSDFSVADLRQRAELLYSKHPFSLVVVDHAGLMAPRKWVSSTTERLNEVLRDLKRMAMGFNRGLGIAVVALFQISREGYKTALKRKEKTGQAGYDLTALSYANEAERCLEKHSKIKTLRGVIEVNEATLEDHVWSSTGWRRVLNKFDNGVRRLWRTTTDRGSVLLTTAPHRIRTVEDGRFAWKAVQSLTPQDYVAGAFGGDCWPKTSPELPDLDVQRCEKRYGERGVELVPPKRITVDLAYLLGAWDGDGKVHSHGIAWTGDRTDVEVRDRLRTSFKATFNHPITLQESPSRLGSFDLVKWSQPLKRWFESIAGQRAGEVPQCVLRAPREVVCAYLQGLFDTDGWINNLGIIGINMKASSEPFLRDIQMLLTSLGIDSHLSFGSVFLKKTGLRYPKVILRVRSRTGREKFAQDIGFTNGERRQRLAGFVLAGAKSNRRNDAQLYPVPQTFMRVYEACGRVPSRLWHLPSKVKATGLVPRGALECLVRHASDLGVVGTDLDFLRKLLELQVMRVVSVEDTGIDEEVVDLEVEGDHEYQTGPVLSHNSSDIVTASWVDDDLIKANRVQFQCLKSRDNAKFETFLARVEWPCRRLITCTDPPLTPKDKKAIGDAIDKAGSLID